MSRKPPGKMQRSHALIVEMARQGKTRTEIAESVGCNPGALGRYLRRAGLRCGDARSNQAPRETACSRHHETVAAMAESGATLAAIGAAVGTTKTHVRKYLTRHSIQRPPWRETPSDAHPMARRTEGALNPAWRGGRMLDKDGYVLLSMPGHPEANRHGYVREHRIVMARMIGRPLLPGEVVDHRNDVRSDNRPENLRLFASNGEHLSTTLTGRWSRASRGLPPSTRKKSTAGDPPSPEVHDRSPA